MTKKPKDASVGPWAREKLDALGQSLNFYTTVLKKQGHWLRGTLYVDAFAGPGFLAFERSPGHPSRQHCSAPILNPIGRKRNF